MPHLRACRLDHACSRELPSREGARGKLEFAEHGATIPLIRRVHEMRHEPFGYGNYTHLGNCLDERSLSIIF